MQRARASSRDGDNENGKNNGTEMVTRPAYSSLSMSATQHSSGVELDERRSMRSPKPEELHVEKEGLEPRVAAKANLVDGDCDEEKVMEPDELQ